MDCIQNDTEMQLRQMVMEGTKVFQDLIIRDMIAEWDERGEGYFPAFLLRNYGRYWLRRALMN